MVLANRLAISYYNTIAVINEDHKIYLVMHQDTNKICIKKILDIYNIDVYKILYNNYIAGTPKIIEYCEDDNKLIIIEEYISGETLSDIIKNDSFTSYDVVSYMLDLCNILSQLHNANPPIIHRDIKPSNIIITSYNKAVLLDFNAAKFFNNTSDEDTVLLGTKGFAAPEQFGFGSSTVQTDIYSLGIVLREMVSSLKECPSYFSPIIDKCTKLNPSERYKNIDELRAALPHLPKEKTPKKVITFSSFLPPGFRSKTPWKIFLATIYYTFIIYLGTSVNFENVTNGVELAIYRMFVFLTFCFYPFGCCNYKGVQSFIPLCSNKNRFVKLFGVIMLNLCVTFMSIFILLIMTMLFFPTSLS